jgi:hypothetical protein
MNLTTGSLFAALVANALGCGFVMYGRKQRRAPPWIAGLALLFGPYFLSSAAWIVVLIAASLAFLWLATRAGL